jgi:hypothetical protein
VRFNAIWVFLIVFFGVNINRFKTDILKVGKVSDDFFGRTLISSFRDLENAFALSSSGDQIFLLDDVKIPLPIFLQGKTTFLR